MSIPSSVTSVPKPDELQAEAASVERLRRQISEISAAGQSATPQMLADFARAQKSYLDHKIEYEKTKRMESGIRSIPSAVRTPPAAHVNAEAVPAAVPMPIKPAEIDETKGLVPASAESIARNRAAVPSISGPEIEPPRKSSHLWILVVIVIAVGGAVVWWLTR